MVKYLLFDYGGVLVNLDRERAVAAFDRLAFDIRPYLGAFGQSGIFSDLECGRIDEYDLCDFLRRQKGRSDLTDMQIIEAWKSFLTGIPQERLDMILKARRHYRTFLLSNTSAIHWLMARDGYFRQGGHRVEDYFEQVFLSYQLGCQKPAPRIFQAVLHATGLPAADFLFLDDSADNCAAAHKLGFQTVLAPAGGGWVADLFNSEGLLCV